MDLLMSWREERGKGEAFPARIGRKLGFAMGLALFLVLLVGGISIFLSSSISRGAKVIKAQSEEIEDVNRLLTMMHHAIEEDQRVVVLGKGVQC
jgi:CHASE3 domain sensor protein